MKVIIAGSRTITDLAIVKAAVKNSGFQITEVVCGGAKGVDTLGAQYAMDNQLSLRTFPADWQKNGKAAGPLRNMEMAKYAEALVLVWDGHSRGSDNMKRVARVHGLKIYEVVV